MDNKKLLNFILKDLSELEELLAEKGSNNFDELEWEFVQTRVSGAKRMIKTISNRENLIPSDNSPTPFITPEKTKNKTVKSEIPVNENKIEPRIEEVEKKIEKEIVPKKEEKEIIENIQENIEEIVEERTEIVEEKVEDTAAVVEEKEVELEEEEINTDSQKTLGDSFSKEKSVNDIVDTDKKNLEQKLSNRPVTSIKSSIGINDRFQFIRELFDGNSDTFSNAVAEIDAKKDIKEAVEYLQQNFKWKKNETSLKFVNLVKRRFSNE